MFILLFCVFEQKFSVQFNGVPGDQIEIKFTLLQTADTVMARGISVFVCGGYSKSHSSRKYLVGLIVAYRLTNISGYLSFMYYPIMHLLCRRFTTKRKTCSRRNYHPNSAQLVRQLILSLTRHSLPQGPLGIISPIRLSTSY